MTIKGTIRARVDWLFNDGAVDNSKLNYARELANGESLDQIESCWHSESISLAEGAEDLYDLTDLVRQVLLDPTYSVSFERIKAIQIVNLSSSGGIARVGNAPYDCWYEPFGSRTDTVDVPLDSALLLSNRRTGWPVYALSPGSSSSSGETEADRMLRVAAVGGDIVYSIAFLGTVTHYTSSSSGA